jgi:hypothetical protein
MCQLKKTQFTPTQEYLSCAKKKSSLKINIKYLGPYTSAMLLDSCRLPDTRGHSMSVTTSRVGYYIMMLMRSFLKDDLAEQKTRCNEHQMAFLLNIFNGFLVPGIIFSVSQYHHLAHHAHCTSPHQIHPTTGHMLVYY